MYIYICTFVIYNVVQSVVVCGCGDIGCVYISRPLYLYIYIYMHTKRMRRTGHGFCAPNHITLHICDYIFIAIELVTNIHTPKKRSFNITNRSLSQHPQQLQAHKNNIIIILKYPTQNTRDFYFWLFIFSLFHSMAQSGVVNLTQLYI